MTLSRREFAKANAAAVAAAVIGLPLPASAANLITNRELTTLKWDKAPCRFCGVGCGVMVATKDGHVVATHGDVKADVNRGLNCIKGYFLSKIMYGGDRKALNLPPTPVRFGGLLWGIAIHDSTHTRDILRALPHRADDAWIREWLASVNDESIPQGVRQHRV